MISIIVAYNNEKLLEEMLVKSLKNQTSKNFELIKVSAKENGFKSASETLNYGASLSKGDILLFIHQDVEFIDNDALEKIEQFCKIYDFGIAGFCGVKDSDKYEVYSSVKIGYDRRHAGQMINEVTDVLSLDECGLIVKKDEFSGFEDNGNTWHFYGVDYSLKSFTANKRILLFPINIYHLSPGWSLDYSYFDTLKVIARKYSNYNVIKTCMGFFRNNNFLSIYCEYRKSKLFLKKIIGIDKK